MIKETGYRQGFPNISRTEFAVDTDEVTGATCGKSRPDRDGFFPLRSITWTWFYQNRFHHAGTQILGRTSPI
jgi:hypothetical protein